MFYSHSFEIQTYIFTEYYNTTLTELIRLQKQNSITFLDKEQKTYLLEQITLGIEFLQSKNIAHCNLTSDSIFCLADSNSFRKGIDL